MENISPCITKPYSIGRLQSRMMASEIASLTIQPFIQGADHRKHQSSASLAFVRGIHRWPVNSPHKGPVTRKMFPFDDVIMRFAQQRTRDRRFNGFVSLKKILKNTAELVVIWDAVTLLSLQLFISWSRNNIKYRADSWFAPSQWEASLQSNAVSH